MRVTGARTSRRILLICSGAAVLVAVAVLVFLPRQKSWPMLGSYASGPRMSSEGYHAVTSIRTDAPRAIGARVYSIVGPVRWNVPSSRAASDETVAEMWLTAGYATYRSSIWTKMSNAIHQALCRQETSEWTLVESKELGESDKLYLRIAPRGDLYVSTAEDREHAVHDGFIADDANAAVNVASVCQAYWANWISNMDLLVQRSLPSE